MFGETARVKRLLAFLLLTAPLPSDFMRFCRKSKEKATLRKIAKWPLVEAGGIEPPSCEPWNGAATCVFCCSRLVPLGTTDAARGNASHNGILSAT